MTFVVAFDGSPLAEAALGRAATYADMASESVIAVAVVPDSARYAREHDWIEETEDFEADAVVARLDEQATTVAPSASFRAESIGPAAPGQVATRLRKVAREVDASVVFIGSENAGRLVIPITSVGGAVAADAAYDVHVVRRPATGQ